jgi:hypothetical protein
VGQVEEGWCNERVKAMKIGFGLGLRLPSCIVSSSCSQGSLVEVESLLKSRPHSRVLLDHRSRQIGCLGHTPTSLSAKVR